MIIIVIYEYILEIKSCLTVSVLVAVDASLLALAVVAVAVGALFWKKYEINDFPPKKLIKEYLDDAGCARGLHLSVAVSAASILVGWSGGHKQDSNGGQLQIKRFFLKKSMWEM